jgi:hypothetical protein
MRPFSLGQITKNPYDLVLLFSGHGAKEKARHNRIKHKQTGDTAHDTSEFPLIRVSMLSFKNIAEKAEWRHGSASPQFLA